MLHTAIMNYLAHFVLAGPQDEAMLGGFLGDFIKGRDLDHLAPRTAREVIIHRRIDRFTDAHPLCAAARRRFAPERRRYAGIALDVFFDHVLAQQFETLGVGSLDTFTQNVYVMLDQYAAMLPTRAATVARAMAQGDWLSGYARNDAVEHALNGISRRLSRGGESLRACVEDLADHGEMLAEQFPVLLRDLQDFARIHREQLDADSARPAQRQGVG